MEIIDRTEIAAAAERLVARGRINDAIEEYSKILRVYSNDTTTLNRIGDLHVRAKNRRSAIEVFERVAKQHASDGFFLKALAIYKKINKLDPTLIRVYEALADLYERQGLNSQAAAQMEVLADYYSKHGERVKASTLRRRVDNLRRKLALPEAEVEDTLASSPVAELPITGVPVVRTTSDMLVFLCHASEDKPAVRTLYSQLRGDQYQPWLDEEDLLPGQQWEVEIESAVRRSHVVIVCLSGRSVTKAGFLQKEIKFAMDILDEQPEGIIFIVPARLEICDVPESLRHLHYVDLFVELGYDKLTRSLDARAKQLGFR